MKSLILFGLFFFASIALLFYGTTINTLNSKAKVILENEKLKKSIDSLKQEVLVKDIRLMKYEYMIDLIGNENPKMAFEINKILSQIE